MTARTSTPKGRHGTGLTASAKVWSAAGLLIAAAVVAYVAFAVAGGSNGNGGTHPIGGQSGSLVMGRRAPDFTASDVTSGKTMTLADLKGKKALLFFSEGSSCQACLVQIRDLEKAGGALRRHGIRLVSVTTDSAEVLRATGKQYGITTPLLSDASRTMSRSYGMLGQGGMGHPETDGHAFMLLDEHGRMVWARAYSEMYVPPDSLLSALP